jgi:lipoprotein-anchoring transpeptidase ErfK/SrfK
MPGAMTAARLAWGLFAVMLALSAVSVAASSPAASRRQESIPSTRLLTLDRSVEARARLHASAHVVAALPVRTQFTSSRMTLPVVGTATTGGVRWVKVRLPSRPDGAMGWVPAAAGTTGWTGWKIVVRRGARRALVFDHGKQQASFAVVVGKPSTPTPLGSFFIVDKIRIAPGVTEGPWALATSAYSYVLAEFAGGDGEIALHGTVGLPDPLGTFSSHGCVRFAPAAITWIARHVGRGTPVIIER